MCYLKFNIERMRKEFTSLFMLSVGGQLVIKGNIIGLCRSRNGILNVHHVGDSFSTVPAILNHGRFTSIQVDRVKLQAS